MHKADLFAYSKEALERFPTQAYLEWKRSRREDLKSWLTGHYCAHYPGNDRYIRAVLRGSEKYQIDHLRNLHELLELDAAGFDTVDLWLVPSTEDGICEVPEFTERLEQQSADYMRILDAYTPDLKNGSGWLDLHGVKQLGKGLFVQDAEDQGEPEAFRRPRLTLMSGRPHQLRLAPPASGRLLIITEHKRAPGTGNGERSYNLFNHALGFEDHARVSAGEQIVGGSWRAKTVAEPEEWSLLVAIWPDGLSPEPLRLEGLLDRAQGKLPAPRNGHEQHQHDDMKQKAKLLRATSVSDMRCLTHAVKRQRERPAEPQIDVMIYDVRTIATASGSENDIKFKYRRPIIACVGGIPFCKRP
jgi:hypothetical protein